MHRLCLIWVVLITTPVLAQEGRGLVEFAEDSAPAAPTEPAPTEPAAATPTPTPAKPKAPAVLAPGLSTAAVDAEGPAHTITTPTIVAVAGGVELMFDASAKTMVGIESSHTYGAMNRAPWLLRPGQWAMVDGQTKVVWEAVTLTPEIQTDAPGTPLEAVPLDAPQVRAFLDAVVAYERETYGPVAGSLQQVDGKWAPAETISEEHLALFRGALWSTGRDGSAEGRLPLDVFRVALWAVSADFTVLEVADWIRSTETIEIEDAVTKAQGLVGRAGPVLAKAGFDHRVISAQFAQFNYNRGILAYQRGDLKAAVHHFDRAISRERTLMSAHYNLGVTYYRAARYQDAADAFLVASGIDGAGADVFFNRGAALYRVGNLLGAARAFRKGVELTPEDEAAKSWLQKADPEGKTAPPPKKKKKRRRRRRRRK